VHDLARYEFGDPEGDKVGHAVDVGDYAARLCTGEAAEVGAQAQLDLVRVDRVHVEVDGRFRATRAAASSWTAVRRG
jgi:hypothetical protein